jgi:hypothetical protein
MAVISEYISREGKKPGSFLTNEKIACCLEALRPEKPFSMDSHTVAGSESTPPDMMPPTWCQSMPQRLPSSLHGKTGD